MKTNQHVEILTSMDFLIIHCEQREWWGKIYMVDVKLPIGREDLRDALIKLGWTPPKEGK